MNKYIDYIIILIGLFIVILISIDYYNKQIDNYGCNFENLTFLENVSSMYVDGLQPVQFTPDPREDCYINDYDCLKGFGLNER